MDTQLIKVVSLDPGVTTGFATGIIRDGGMIVDSDQQKWNHIGLYNWLRMQAPDFIVCERFDYRQRQSKVELFSRELIGVAELYCQLNGVELHMQMPAEVIGGYYNKEKLKDTQTYRPGKPHANDAMAHLLHWFTFKQGYKYNVHGFRRK